MKILQLLTVWTQHRGERRPLCSDYCGYYSWIAALIIIIVCPSDTTSLNATMRSLLVLLSINIMIKQENQWITGCFGGEIHFFCSLFVDHFDNSDNLTKITTEDTTPQESTCAFFDSLSHNKRLSCGGDVVMGIFVIFWLEMADSHHFHHY